MNFKEKVYTHYRQLLDEKINLLQKTLDDLKESGRNETKSTAGDKHETALAMLQIEQENTRAQLKQALEQKTLFNRIDITLYTAQISLGSLVTTNKGYLFVSIALRKTIVDGITVTSVSTQSPLGIKLMGLSAGSSVEVNGMSYKIEQVE